MSVINKPQISAEPQQTIFGNRYTAEGFLKAAQYGLNAMDYFYRAARRRGNFNDLRILSPVSSQKTYDYLFEKALYARRFFDRMGFAAEFIIMDKLEGDREDSFGFSYEHPETETRFSVTIKLIMTTTTHTKRAGSFFGLDVWYNRWNREAPTDPEITNAIKRKFKLEELRPTHVRAIKLGYGDTLQLGKTKDGWIVEEIAWTQKKGAK